MAGKNNDGGQDVFDVANWLDRANGRVQTPSARPVEAPAAVVPSYAPRHRADVPVDSVA